MGKVIETKFYEILNLTKEEKRWAVILHLSMFSGIIIPLAGIVAPVIIWFAKRRSSTFIDSQGKEVLNFIITMIVAFAVARILAFVFIGLLLLLPLALFALIMPVIAASRCHKGAAYKYPYIFRPIK